ncbi:hypothetical protein D3C80_1924040 [compost metagenome]
MKKENLSQDTEKSHKQEKNIQALSNQERSRNNHMPPKEAYLKPHRKNPYNAPDHPPHSKEKQSLRMQISK